MKNITVNITQEHIDNSNTFCSEKCMVANALYDSGFKGVSVGYNDFVCFSEIKKDNFVNSLPKSIVDKIHDFDCGNPVTPFSFIVKNVPERFLIGK